jgi:hypothetical protein
MNLTPRQETPRQQAVKSDYSSVAFVEVSLSHYAAD